MEIAKFAQIGLVVPSPFWSLTLTLQLFVDEDVNATRKDLCTIGFATKSGTGRLAKCARAAEMQ